MSPAAIWQALRRLPSVVTSLGWNVLGLGLLCGVLGIWLGWRELDIIAVACAVLLVLAAGYLFGRAELETAIELTLNRAAVGHNALVADDPTRTPAQARITVRNVAGRSSGVLGMEIPVGREGRGPDVVERIRIPSLGVGGSHSADPFDLPTDRRGVIVLGPASVVRTDPLGLLRREATWSASREFFVHPRTVGLDQTGAGLLRDLEGQASNDLSMNDVAFHALREYEPGDPLRHVHALTSARVGRLMVRQFIDTRAAHLTVVVSGAAQEYRDESEDEFETALSIGSSLALRAVHDEQRVSILAAGYGGPMPARITHRLVLDGFSRARFGAPDSALVRLTAHAVRVAPETSLAALVTGGGTTIAQIRAAAGRFGAGVRVVGIQVVPGARPTAQRAGRIRLLTVPALGDLRSAMRAAMRL